MRVVPTKAHPHILKAVLICTLIALLLFAVPISGMGSARAETPGPVTDPAVQGDGEHYLGFQPFKAGAYQLMPGTLAQGVPPTSVDLSSQMPPVGNQGSQGSCVAWATSYYYKSWQEKQEHTNWDLANTWYQFSPSFIYNQINGGVDQGSSFWDAFRVMQNTGDVDIAEMPYSQSNWTKQPTAAQLQAASPYRISANWNAFWNQYDFGPYNPPNDISGIKNWLASGKILVMGIPIFYDFPNFSGAPAKPYYDYNGTSSFAGGHGVCIVGYDDNINPGGSDADHRGGFKMVNSWGPNWNGTSHGYVYLSYDFVKRYVWEAWAMNDLSPDDPHIDSVSPTSGQAGTSVIITGYNFGTARRNAAVSFNGVTATTTSFTNTSIVCTVPPGAGAGQVVVMDWDGKASNGVAFTSGYAVSASVVGGHGTVTPASQNVVSGGTAVISLIPDTGYHVASITDNGIPVPGPFGETFSIPDLTANHAVEVTFAINSYTVSASVPGGKGTASPASQMVDYGGTANIGLVPDAGMFVTLIMDNGSVVPGPYGSSYSINGIAADHVVEVTFSDTYTVTASSAGNGTVAPLVQSAAQGGSATITLAPGPGWHVSALTDNGVTVPGPYGGAYTIDNISGDHTVVVTFELNTFAINVSVLGGHGVANPLSQILSLGSNLSIDLVPDTGYHVASITDNGERAPGPYSTTYTINNILEAHDVEVTFAINIYDINVGVSGGHGTVSPASQQAEYGSHVSVALLPDAGYHVSSIVDGAMRIGGPYTGTYTISGLAADHSVLVTFAQNTYYQYFAGGNTAPGSRSYLCIANSNATDEQVGICLVDAGGLPADSAATWYPVPGNSRLTIDVNSLAPSGSEAIKLIYHTLGIVAENPVYFDYFGMTGGFDTVGAASPATDWYFAEGCTLPGFYEYVTVVNCSGAGANLTFHFQTDHGEIDRTAALPGNGTGTFLANELLGPGYQSALALAADQPVVASRSMYFDYQGTGNWGWDGGSLVIGATALSNEYYFAEGTTRAGFEEWLTIQNPQASAITVNAAYQLGHGQGANVFKQYSVAAHSRVTLFVPTEVGLDKDVSVHLSSGSAFLAERPLYFDYTGFGADWTGGTCVIGAASPRATWFFAEGCTLPGFQEYLTLQNPGSQNAVVQISYLTQNGPLPSRSLTVPAGSRVTVPVNADAGSGYQLSCRLQVTNGPGIIAERPMYFNYGGWTGGHDVVGSGY